MITIALSKGRIFDETVPLLAAAGVATRDDPETSRKLVLATNRSDVRVIIVRATDVPTYVQYGAADMGVAGKDVLGEHGGEGLYQPLDLNIARCRMMVAVADGFDYHRAVRQGARLKVATKYVQTAREHFASKGVHVDLIRLYGSMELAPLVGLADAIVDLVSTGNTLKANGLTAVEEIASISARLDREPGRSQTQTRSRSAAARLLRARGAVMRRLATSQPDFDARLAELLAFEAAQDPQVDAVVGLDPVGREEPRRRCIARIHPAIRQRSGEYRRGARSRQSRMRCKPLRGCPGPQRAALETAARRVRDYHEKQRAQSWTIKDDDGNELGQRVTPLDRVGVYVPGGKAAYPSSVIMNVMPAKVAGVAEVVMAVPTPGGERNPLVLAAAALCGVDRVFTIGGAQAIGALAYGTQHVPAVDKIVGPGQRLCGRGQTPCVRHRRHRHGCRAVGNPRGRGRHEQPGLDRDGSLLAGRARRARAGDPRVGRSRVHPGGGGRASSARFRRSRAGR